MGLAASQARLLFITSRQNDVSAQMQRISNQNMILARDEDEVSEKYNRMLSGTKLVTTDGADLSYENLMGAAGAAAGLTSASVIMKGNKVALSPSSVANYGLPESGNPGDIATIYPTAKDFVKKVTGSDEIANAVKTDAVNNTTATGGVLTSEMKTKLKNFKATYGSYPTQKGPLEVKNIVGNAKVTVGSDWKKTYNDNIANSYSLSDLINGNTDGDIIIHLADDDSAKGKPTSEAKNNMNVLAKSIITAIAKAMGITNTSQVMSMMKSTLDDFSKIVEDLTDGENRGKYYSSAGPNTDNALRNKDSGMALVAEGCAHKGTDRDFYKVNATTLSKFLLERMLRLFGADTKEGDGVARNCSTFAIKNMEYDEDQVVTYSTNEKGYSEAEYQKMMAKILQIPESSITEEMLTYLGKTKASDETSGGSATGTATAESQASYYKSIYDKLNTYGWITDTLVTDSSKLTEALKNGTYTINGASAKASGLFEETTDTDATAKAEAFWKTEMQKIQRKEKQLDTQLTKLQTEYSSLTNDYNSVKSILDANVQKSFSYCQNG